MVGVAAARVEGSGVAAGGREREAVGARMGGGVCELGVEEAEIGGVHLRGEWEREVLSRG
jgi:hypothetical protein